MSLRTLIRPVLDRFTFLLPLARWVNRRFFAQGSVSSHYIALSGETAALEGERLRSSWQDDSIPQKQRELVAQQLTRFRAGQPVDVFDVFVNALRALPDMPSGASLLEIGCSSGFYAEVIDIAGLDLRYAGCDYSEPFIRLAREQYPHLPFAVEDATDLHYADQAFDVVVSGCCLLHIPQYRTAILETARVAKSYVIFHRTPVLLDRPEQWYRKQAYGVETVEIHFNEAELLAFMAQNGLQLIATYTLSEDRHEAVRSYVCRKI